MKTIAVLTEIPRRRTRRSHVTLAFLVLVSASWQYCCILGTSDILRHLETMLRRCSYTQCLWILYDLYISSETLTTYLWEYKTWHLQVVNIIGCIHCDTTCSITPLQLLYIGDVPSTFRRHTDSLGIIFFSILRGKKKTKNHSNSNLKCWCIDSMLVFGAHSSSWLSCHNYVFIFMRFSITSYNWHFDWFTATDIYRY